jgi:hypothetical protein
MKKEELKIDIGVKSENPATFIPEIWGRELAAIQDAWLFNYDVMFGKQKQRFHEWYGKLSRWEKLKYHARKFRSKLWMMVPIRIITTKRYEDLQNQDW